MMTHEQDDLVGAAENLVQTWAKVIEAREVLRRCCETSRKKIEESRRALVLANATLHGLVLDEGF
jgi:hypothetical protein